MKTVLLVEDEILVMKLLRQMLKQYIVLEATGAEQALSHFTENRETIGLLIADVTLPTSSGIQLALRLRAEVPALPVILTSGYPLSGWRARDSADLATLGVGSVTFLQKPFRSQLLLSAVSQLIGSQQTATAGAA